MPRSKLRLGPYEGRDGAGVIHEAERVDEAGLYLSAKCNGQPIGTNPEGLRRYCNWCFPDRFKDKVDYTKGLPSLDLDGGDDVGNFAGAKRIAASQYVVEEVTVNSWDVPKPIPKPKTTKSLDEILRKDKVTFKRRPIVTYNDYGRFLKKS